MSQTDTADKKQKSIVSKKSWKSTLSIFEYLKPYSWYFYGALALLVVGSLLMMAIMGIPGEMVHAATGQKGMFDLTLNEWGLIMFIFLGARALLSFVQTILFANVSERGMADIRRDLYERLITQPMDYFEQFRVGELTSRITADVEQLQSVFSVTLAETIRQSLILILELVFWHT